MSRFRRLDVCRRVLETGLVPVFFEPDVETATEIARAVHAAGCRVLEFTNRADHAWATFAELDRYCARHLPDLVLGAGSVVDAPTAALYVNSGAAFIVGPNFSADIARFCNRRKVAYAPGCGSASEIADAEELGCEIVKIFPGEQVGGPEFVKAVLGPCPWSLLMPTGGVEPTEASLTAWFGAGAACVGMGSKLFPRDAIKRKDWAAITAVVREALAIIARVRPALR